MFTIHRPICLRIISAFSMHFLLLFLLKFPSVVDSHNFSPLQPARHFDERLLRESPPATIKVVTKNGTKKLQLVEEGGKKVWRWVVEGGNKPVAVAKPKPAASPAPAAKAPAGPVLVFDPPTPEEQRELRLRLEQKQGISLKAPKDVYYEYRSLLKLEDNKKFIPSKTHPAKVVGIGRGSDNLYKALAYALAGTELLHTATRIYVRNYFEGFFGQWEKRQAQPWLDDFDVRSVRRQAEKMKDGKAGGMVELLAAVKKFNINVLVYKTDKNQWLCLSPKTAHKADLEKNMDCQNKDTMTIALELYDNDNFDVVLDVEQKK